MPLNGLAKLTPTHTTLAGTDWLSLRGSWIDIMFNDDVTPVQNGMGKLFVFSWKRLGCDVNSSLLVAFSRNLSNPTEAPFFCYLLLNQTLLQSSIKPTANLRLWLFSVSTRCHQINNESGIECYLGFPNVFKKRRASPSKKTVKRESRRSSKEDIWLQDDTNPTSMRPSMNNMWDQSRCLEMFLL